jgi:isopenicillin N synthase-like dioxygenase
MSETSFPIVSFKPFLTGTEAEQRKVAQELYDAFHKFGWIYLKDFGINQEEIEEMFAIVRRLIHQEDTHANNHHQSKKYFDRPLETKMKDRLVDAAVNQGYTPDGAGTNNAKETDYKESYEHRRWNNDLCPSDGELAGFREFMDGFYSVLDHFSFS